MTISNESLPKWRNVPENNGLWVFSIHSLFGAGAGTVLLIIGTAADCQSSRAAAPRASPRARAAVWHILCPAECDAYETATSGDRLWWEIQRSRAQNKWIGNCTGSLSIMSFSRPIKNSSKIKLKRRLWYSILNWRHKWMKGKGLRNFKTIWRKLSFKFSVWHFFIFAERGTFFFIF